MFPAPNNIYARATLLAQIRTFFAARDVLEVETPLLDKSTNPAPHLDSFQVDNFYLQTSPEFAMKKLLAAGSGDIYQICKAFRRGETGHLHNHEFTILEWYRIGFNHHDLMNEMDEFLQIILQCNKAEHETYQNLCAKYLQINPHTCTLKELKNCAAAHKINFSGDDNLDTWLQLLFTHLVEPQIGKIKPIFVYDFPASQAMLARLTNDTPPVAERFEVYFQGIELANGFHELNDAEEQRQRFLQDLHEREKLNLPPIPLDEKFLASLPRLPDCAGVAVGIDRLLFLNNMTQGK